MEQNKESNVLKNLPQRISQLGLMAFAVSAGIAVYYYFLGLYISSVMVASFAFCAAAILTLQYFKILKRAQTFILASICLMLITSGFIEGAGTGQYFYFFAIIVVIPVIVDYKNSSNIEFFYTYTAVIISFAICFYVGQTFKPFETISLPVKHQMLYSNA